jgi:hypothetical protein
MGFLDSLFRAWHRRGRLAPPPKRHTGGAMAPASTQRASLALKDVDLPAGVVRLRTGEVRAILLVKGIPLHQRDAEAAEAFMQDWAAALNGLPADTCMLARTRPGGLEGYMAEKGTAANALATVAPGTGLARLAADQLRNALHLTGSGLSRDTVGYLAVRDAKGDVRALLERAATAAARLTDAGLTATPLKDKALLDAVAGSWQPPYTESLLFDYYLQRGVPGMEWTMVADGDGRTTRARVTRPRYAEAPADEGAVVTSLPAPAKRIAAARPTRKALPR